MTTFVKLPHSNPQRNANTLAPGESSKCSQGSGTETGAMGYRGSSKSTLTPDHDSSRGTRGTRLSPAACCILPPVLPSRTALAFVTALVAGAPGFACGDDPGASPASEREATAEALADRLRAADPLDILALLARPHAEVRDALGPHALTAQTTLSLRPTDPAAANPPLEAAVAPNQALSDQLALRWDSPDAAGPRFALEQHNDQARGRSIVAVDGTLFAKLEHRPWTRHPLESEIHELWLDDAWKTAHDAVEFLLPGATLTASEAPGEGWNDGDAVRLTLQLGAGTPTDRATPGWRTGVAFSALSGEVLVDVQTGAWLKVDTTATYTVQGGTAGPLAGHFEVHGVVATTLPSAPQVRAPPDAVALPERHRYEEERKRLLDGLAAP